MKESSSIGMPAILSLEKYYQFGSDLHLLGKVILLKDIIDKPWYDRSSFLKLLSLPVFIWQFFLLSRKFSFFLFFVDTGVLERTAIKALKFLGRRTIVLQDGIKRKPAYEAPGALTWFGGAGADLYLVMGKHYLEMTGKKNTEIVGSPIYNNKVKSAIYGNKILVVNQCFARYGETTKKIEFRFIKQIVKAASGYGKVELRLHPHNNPEQYIKLQSSGVDVSWNRPLKQSLDNAGIVIAINSTVIMEALIRHLPVIVLQWHPSPFLQPFNTGIIKCKNISEMRMALESWVKSKVSSPDPVETIQKEMESFVACTGHESVVLIVQMLDKFISETGDDLTYSNNADFR